VRSNTIRRAVSVFDNLPVPAGSAAGVVVVFLLDLARPAPLPGSRALQRTAGAALLAAGCGLNAWALVERRRRTSGEFQLEEPEAIVTSGPYAVSRHPMYLGWWLIHSGAGLLRGSAWVAATLPAAMLAEHVGGALVEERDLRRRFGAEYARYAARVPRYAGLPRRGAAPAGLSPVPPRTSAP
jgi:protein-S-isoprenylcysteine O-methyltransferase Ste14